MEGFYNKSVKCPVCSDTFNVLKIRSGATRAIKKDEDFCTYYEPINPILYSVWVCSECGYANMEDKFEKLSDKDAKILYNKVKPKWTPRDFSGERDLQTAIEAYMLVLLNLQLRKAKNSETARICIRIAWIYRYLNDSKETQYLKNALTAYKSAFENENLPNDILDEITCMYMIGELSRRLGEPLEGAKWFHRVISSKLSDNLSRGEKARTKMLIEMSRDQIQNIRENR